MPLTEIELRRTPHDRRLYALPGFGTVRFEGFWTRRGVADADGERWVFGRTGFWKRIIAATDPTGSIVGRFVPREIRRGGKLSWRGAEYTVAPASLLRERYALRTDGVDEDIALLEGKSWGKRPVRIALADPEALEPGLLLFAAYVVQQLANSAADNASAGSVAVMSASS